MRTGTGDEARSLADLKICNDLAAMRFQVALIRLELKSSPRPEGGDGGGRFAGPAGAAKGDRHSAPPSKPRGFMGVAPALTMAGKVADVAGRGALLVPLAEAAPVVVDGAATLGASGVWARWASRNSSAEWIAAPTGLGA